jgi:hypothetical protein
MRATSGIMTTARGITDREQRIDDECERDHGL